MRSIFIDKNELPTDHMLRDGIGKTYAHWQELVHYTTAIAPDTAGNWHFSGQKFGWSFRIAASNRILIYLLPREGFFKVAFVFGEKATLKILESNVADVIKTALAEAKPYAEGRGIRVEIKDDALITDIKKLIDVKLEK